MRRPWLCTVCSYPAHPIYSDFKQGVWTNVFCSKECRNSTRSKVHEIRMVILLLVWGFFYRPAFYLGVAFCILAEVWVQYNRQLVRIRNRTRNELSTSIDVNHREPTTSHQRLMERVRQWRDLRSNYYWVSSNNQPTNINRIPCDTTSSTMIFSEILGRMVSPCCYQTARLNEAYCMCGRALHYKPILVTIDRLRARENN